MKYLLDTNVVSELARARPNPTVVAWTDGLEPDSAYLSVITIGELSKGVEKLPASPRKDELLAWLQQDLLLRFAGRILPLDVDAMLAWGRLVGGLERAGKPRPAMDTLVAALALHHGLTLATRNEADFEGTGVQVVNPWQA